MKTFARLLAFACLWGIGTVSKGSIQSSLRIAEIMYHPASPSTAEAAAGYTDSEQFEFIKLINISASENLDLTGVRFTDGITFTFGAISLSPGAHTFIVSNTAAFSARYAAGNPIAGQYSGGLNNAGDHMRLVDAIGSTVHDFTYDDTGTGWHPSTDGDGYSLVILDLLSPVASWNNASAWAPSAAIGGTPETREVPEASSNIAWSVLIACFAVGLSVSKRRRNKLLPC